MRDVNVRVDCEHINIVIAFFGGFVLYLLAIALCAPIRRTKDVLPLLRNICFNACEIHISVHMYRVRPIKTECRGSIIVMGEKCQVRSWPLKYIAPEKEKMNYGDNFWLSPNRLKSNIECDNTVHRPSEPIQMHENRSQKVEELRSNQYGTRNCPVHFLLRIPIGDKQYITFPRIFGLIY